MLARLPPFSDYCVTLRLEKPSEGWRYEVFPTAAFQVILDLCLLTVGYLVLLCPPRPLKLGYARIPTCFLALGFRQRWCLV